MHRQLNQGWSDAVNSWLACWFAPGCRLFTLAMPQRFSGDKHVLDELLWC